MVKKIALSQQPNLFRREIPQMPEGYYSPGPNPNLRRFVEEHATPYDPEADRYSTRPFSKPLEATKATVIYNMHSYHQGKKPHDPIREYIQHYTQPGNIVLDPFSGSGGTALAALMEGRAAIAIDLSPAATFITKNYCTPVDVDELQRAFEALERKVKPEMDWLYETRCDRCDGRATTAYTVYSYVFQCPRCLEKVPLFDCPEIQTQTAKGKPKKIRICPHCQARGHQEEIKTTGVRFDPIPVLVSYFCNEGCTPKRSERRYNDLDEKKRRYFEQYDLSKIHEIESKPIPHWVPPHRMMNVESDTEPWGDKWRAGTSSFRTVAELFTKRNLWALAAYAEVARTSQFSDLLLATLTASCFHASRMSHHKEGGGGITTGTYYLPQLSKERNVLDLLSRKFNDIQLAATEINQTLESNDLLVSTQSATDLSSVLSDSIDLVFTDPPYAGNVQYGELNFVWEAWLSFDTHWHDQEIIVNETRDKSDDYWAHLMTQAMAECYRVLKPGRWISLCYHDTSEGTWQLVQDLMTEVGFIPEQAETTLYINTGQKSYNQITADKVTKRDLVINFRKPRAGELSGQMRLLDASDFTTFQDAARAVLAEALTAHPGSTADRLYDELVSRMVRRGQFERHNFDALLRSVAEEVGSRWYLLETAGQVDEAESRKETAAAMQLETFMRGYLDGHREESGVHYSELFEQYLPVQDKPRRLLQDWLPEYFYKTQEGTWRPPADDAERQQKAALRASGDLRRIRRFANALLGGVPPATRDSPASPADLADWIYQCRRAGLYDLGRALYEKGGLRFDQLSEEAQLRVEEDYQICVDRGKIPRKLDQPGSQSR